MDKKDINKNRIIEKQAEADNKLAEAEEVGARELQTLLTNPDFKAYIQQLQEQSTFTKTLKETYDEKAFFWNEPTWALTGVINHYIYDNRLEGSTEEQREAHKEPFLAFFTAFYKEWEAIKITNKETTYEEISKAIVKVFHENEMYEGRIAEEAIEAVMQKMNEQKQNLKTQTAETVALIEGFSRSSQDTTVDNPDVLKATRSKLAQLSLITPNFVYGLTAAMPISKITQKQVAIAKGNGKIANVEVGNKENSVIIKASITTKGDLPPEAIEIQNVIGELIQANGNRQIHVTKAQIWRAFACLEDGAKVTKQSQEYIGEIINLLAEAIGEIDFTQQIEKHTNMKKEPGFDYKETVIRGPLVMMDETTVKAGGHKTEGFILYRLPLFYLHAHMTGQITRINRALLDTTVTKITGADGKKRTVETRQNDIGFIMLKRHLARQIEYMKTDKKTGNYEGRRSFETIEKSISKNELTDRQRRTMREDIDILCTRWKIQGHIKDYSLYKNRGSRALVGVKIEV